LSDSDGAGCFSAVRGYAIILFKPSSIRQQFLLSPSKFSGAVEMGLISPTKELEMKILLLALAVGTLLAAGCNTVHGLGRDIERGGEKTQDAADAVQRKM
jgi:predicted small secreted protein